jgi:hypothetical protein
MAIRLLLLAGILAAGVGAQTPSATFTTLYNFAGCNGAAGSDCDGISPGSVVAGSGGVL